MLCPEIRVRQAMDFLSLWQDWEKEAGKDAWPPYWAVVWPSAAVIARWLMDHPEEVKGKNVVDIGCGGGVAGIGAMLAGAALVTGNDIDAASLVIAQANAAKNGVNISVDRTDRLGQCVDNGEDVILVSDMFYKKTESLALIALLEKAKARGASILVSDPGRPFAPKGSMKVLTEADLPSLAPFEGIENRLVRLFRYN
jgi:predicted nicotinamide N-methyase